MHQSGRLRAQVPKAVNNHTRRLALPLETLQRLVANDHAAPRGLLPGALRTPDLNRLSGYAGRDRMPDVHGIGIHDPGHGLLVGAHVRRRNVELGTEAIQYLRRVSPRDALQFSLG